MKTPEKISVKLKFRIMLVCFAIYAVATGASFLYLIYKYDNVEESFKIENKLKNDLSELRNKQYELFNLYNGKKDKEREDELIESINSICHNIEEEIKYLNEKPIENNRKIKQSTIILKDEFTLYKQKNEEIRKIENEITELVQDGGRLMTSRSTVWNSMLQTSTGNTRKTFEEIIKCEASFLENCNIEDYKKINKLIDNIITTLKKVAVSTKNSLVQYQMYKLDDQLAEYKVTFNLVFSKILTLGLNNYEGFKGEANSQVATMHTNLEEMIVESTQQRYNIKKATIIKVLGLQILMLAIGVPFFLILFWSINRPIQTMNNYLARLMKGELVSAEISPDSSNEMDLMSLQLSEFINNLKEKQQFTEDIGNGKRTNGFKLLSDTDELGNALIRMKQNLDEQTEKQIKRRKEDEIQDKINIGLADFGNILRKNNDNIDKLCNETIKALIHYMDANYGSIYIYNDEEPDDIHLDMKATYAADRKKFITKKIALYEGIIGTCAVEKTMQIIDDIPKDYVKIGSGFGNTNPSNLIVMPLLLNTEIYGVVELCRTSKFEEYRIKFLERIAEEIASTISYVKENAKNLFKLHEKGKRLEDYTKRLHKAKGEIAAKDQEIKKYKDEIEKLTKENARLTEEKSDKNRK